MEISIYFALVASVFSLLANAVRMLESQHRWIFHLVVSLVSLYFAIVYLLVLADILPLSTFGANFLRPGTAALMACLGAFAIAYRPSK